MIVACLGAAPAASSYNAVEGTIERIRAEWAKPDAPAQPNAPGWNALFDALVADLQSFTAATNEAERLAALNRAYRFSVALGSVSWKPAAELRESLREWLRPRVRLAWAERRLVEWVHNLPPAPDPAVQGNRQNWVRFVDNDLGAAMKQYDSAATVAQRATAFKAVNTALASLQNRNQASPWVPSVELQAALNDLYNQPNFDISVDVTTLSPVFNTNLITSGPVTRKGYVSQVTAGPKTGFGLAWCNDGIAFYNSQAFSTYTPIWDFQNQVQSNKQGKRAAKMYEFHAASSDASELTIMSVIRPSGLSITPSYKHNVGADISTTPQPGGGFARAVASLVGYNQPKITRLAYEQAIGRIASGIEAEAMEEGLERTGQEAAVRNRTLAQYLIGNNRATFRNILIENLALRSRPENALIGGLLKYANAGEQVGADASQPPVFATPDSGVSADLHLSSIMTNFTRGYLQSDAAKDVNNLMVVTQKVAPDAPPASGVKVVRNTDYPTFLHAIETAQSANDPKVLAIRVKRPKTAPDFGVDAKGNLVALVNDFQIEVPVPPQNAKGGAGAPPARVFRIVSPQAEFVISFKVEAKSEKEPLRLTGRIEGFDPGPNAKIYGINEDENQATQVGPLPTFVILGVFRSKLQGQPIDIPLSNVQLRGFAIRSVSPLDPSGWIRVNLDRTSNSPAAGIQ